MSDRAVGSDPAALGARAARVLDSWLDLGVAAVIAATPAGRPEPSGDAASVLARLGLAVAGVFDLVEQLAAADDLVAELLAENEQLRECLAGAGLLAD